MPTRNFGSMRLGPIRGMGIPRRQASDEPLGETYIRANGRPFGDWILGRNAGTPGEAIANPVYIIESILRDSLGISGDQINTSSFDDLGNWSNGRRNGWRFARAILHEEDSFNTIQTLAEESACVYLYDYAGRERLVALDHYNPSLELGPKHIAEDKSGKPMVVVRQTHVRHIRNEFFLNYRYDYTTGKMNRQMYLTSTGSNMKDISRNDKPPFNTYIGLCKESQRLYNKVERWVFDAQWIRDDTTAEYFLKTMADWLALRKWQIDATLWYSPDTLRLEHMDQVLWTLDLLPISMQNKTVTGVKAVGHNIGGNLSDGTYYYVVSGVDAYGETKMSDEVSATISESGGNGRVDISWNPLHGVAKYRVYGRTSASQNIYFETTQTQFTDTGATGTSGRPFAVATAYFVTRIIDYGIKSAKLKMEFVACPVVFF